ncbi:hypothetical protein MKX03_015874, partial [Papaver bracteatum]
MLEILHIVGIMHGDFKPDDLLNHYTRSQIPIGLLDVNDVRRKAFVAVLALDVI